MSCAFAGRREGHLRKDCKERAICVACGLEGHERKNCPRPDPARLEALGKGPKVWCVCFYFYFFFALSRITDRFLALSCLSCSFRCGVEGHVLKDCPQPPKCFSCGETGHQRKDCPTRPPPPVRTAPAEAKPEAAAAA
ncbi:hypothetical protein B0H12DRAFT_1030646 [Mycena haematopus]|nr:hypothetical protein B0H12DRAFT_1030646 [Mycena haematopus]